MRCRQDTKCPSQCLGLWMKGPGPINREKNPAITTGCTLLEAGTAVFSSSIPSPAPENKPNVYVRLTKPNVAWRFHGERFKTKMAHGLCLVDPRPCQGSESLLSSHLHSNKFMVIEAHPSRLSMVFFAFVTWCSGMLSKSFKHPGAADAPFPASTGTSGRSTFGSSNFSGTFSGSVALASLLAALIQTKLAFPKKKLPASC